MNFIIINVTIFQHTQIIRELEQEIEPPVLKTFQPLERKTVPKVIDKPVEAEIQSPRRPAVPPPQPPVAKPSVNYKFNYLYRMGTVNFQIKNFMSPNIIVS